VTDALGGIMATEYDAVGNVSRIADPIGRVVEYVYDELNRRVSQIAPDPDGTGGPQQAAVTRYVYDAVGNLTAVRNALDHVTATEYDALNRSIKTTDPLGANTLFHYDAIGNLLSLTDPVGNTTVYTYDALSRLIQEEDAFGASHTFSFDAVNNLVSEVDALGRRTAFTYDALNRATGEQWLDPFGASVRSISRIYNAAGELTRVSDPDATYTMQYDGLGRMISIDNAGSAGQPHVELDYGYDRVGNVLEIAHRVDGADAYFTDYTYDALNRVVEIAQSGAAVAAHRVEFSYNAASEMTGLMRFDSAAATTPVITSSYVYDGAGRLTHITHSNASAVVADFIQGSIVAQRLLVPRR
jgi:YD repeat-containing protein